MLNVWPKILFEKFFKMRAYAFKDSNFEKLIEDGIQHKHFTKLYGTSHIFMVDASSQFQFHSVLWSLLVCVCVCVCVNLCEFAFDISVQAFQGE